MKRVVKWIIGVVAGLVILFVGLGLYVQLAWDARDDRPAPQMVAARDAETIARGEHIFKYSWQCWGCHTTEGDANTPPAGGRVFDLRAIGPGFGLFYSKNLTPDSATGLGKWTDGEIVQSIREGITHDRRMLFPLMPVDWLKGMSDEDALAIVAYLRSLPPVSNQVPERELSFIAKTLIAFNIIKPMEPIVAPVVAPPRGRTIEYGKYVASNLTGCAECHSPRNLQDGSFYPDSLFAGGNIAFGEEEGNPVYAYASNLRPEPETGIMNYTEEQFLEAVTAGMRPDSTVLTPHMLYPYYKFLPEDDLRAVFLFLKSLQPVRRETLPVRYSSEVQQARGTAKGALLFQARCEPCHGKEGEGAVPTNVKLAEVASSMEDDDLREFIAGGQMNLKMPPFGKTLSWEELDDVISYIRSWEKRSSPVASIVGQQ